MKGNERRCHAYEEADSCDEHTSAEIAILGLKRQRVNAIACDVEAGDFCYFSLVRISVAVCASSWESVYVSWLVVGTEIGSRVTANVCDDVEKESRNDDDEAEVSFGGRLGCGIWNVSESANV